MKKTVKILLGAALVFAATLTILIILTAVFFPAEKIKSLIISKVSEAIDMPLSIDDIGISFAGIPALKISGIAVGEPVENAELYAEIRSIRVKVNLLKILKKEVEIVSVELEAPYISMTIPAAPDIPETDDSSSSQNKIISPPDIPALPVPVTLRTMRISNGRADIVNAGDGSTISIDDISQKLSLDISRDLKSINSTGVLTLNEITFSPGKNSPADPLPSISDLSVRIGHEFNGDLTTGNISITSGDLTVGKLPFEFAADVANWTVCTFGITSENLDIRDILALVPSGMIPDIEKISADGHIVLSVNGTVDMSRGETEIAYDGSIEVGGMSVSHDDFPQNIETITARISFDENDLNIGNVSVGAGNSTVSVSGSVTSYIESPAVAVTVDGNIDIGEAAGSLPDLDEYNLGGAIVMDLSVQGSPEDPKSMTADGMVTLNDVAFVVPETLNNPGELNGKISISPQSLTIETLTMISGKTDVNFSGGLSGYKNLAFPEDGAKADFKGRITSELIDLGDLLVKTEDTAQSEPAEPFDLEETLKTLPIPPNLSVETTFELGKIVSGKLNSDSARGNILFDSGILEMQDLEVSAYNGSMGGATKVNFTDLENVTYDGSFKLNGFDSGAFFAGLFDIGDTFSGILSSSLSFSGAGLDSLSIVKNLSCNGNMRFENGQIKDWDFTNKLGSYLKFLDLGTVNFDTIANSFSVKDSRMYTPDMSLSTDHGTISVDGSAGFDTSVDYKITMLLNKDAAKSASKQVSALAGLIGDDPDTLELIIETGGTLKNPKFSLDTSKAKKQVKEELKTKAQDFLEEKIKDPALKEKGEKLLKSLFR
jgi:uncharacterized protein involved in outer membrane biogenesis